MCLEELAWSRCFWLFLLSANPGTKPALTLPVGKDFFFPELDKAHSIIERFMEVYKIDDISVTAFIKFIIKLSYRKATVLYLPEGCTLEAFTYAADECPDLRILRVPPGLLFEMTVDYVGPSTSPSGPSSSTIWHKRICFTDALGKWKSLEGLMLDTSYSLVDILNQLRVLDYKNFSGLRLNGAGILEEHALAIVTVLPNIKRLYLRKASINRENLVSIIKGCRKLVTLDVSYCVGFEVDEEMLKLTSPIPTFKFEGATLYEKYDALDLDIDADSIDGYDSG